MSEEERKFSIWRPLFGKMAEYDCELTAEEVEPYLRQSYWSVQEDTGTGWPYEWQDKALTNIVPIDRLVILG
jgi:hypothetical protein